MRKLLYWLGPWVNQKRSPRGITRDSIVVDEGFSMWIYSPRKTTGAMFVIPGIHYEGPADIRVDRFARVLADSGMVVGVPLILIITNTI